eukprot:1193266-Prorocentrum_minimum.AAC.2
MFNRNTPACLSTGIPVTSKYTLACIRKDVPEEEAPPIAVVDTLQAFCGGNTADTLQASRPSSLAALVPRLATHAQ